MEVLQWAPTVLEYMLPRIEECARVKIVLEEDKWNPRNVGITGGNEVHYPGDVTYG